MFYKILILLFLLPSFLSSVWGQAQSSSHYVSLRGMGQPKYKQNFSHFAYANPEAPKGGHLNLSTSRRFNGFNPYVDVGVTVPEMELTFATLMKPARDNLEASYPYLAQSVMTDPAHGFVVFSLRKEATFHNGDPITAEDVAFSFNLLKKEGKLSFRSLFQQVAKVEILDPCTLKFVFQGPNRDLAYHLGSFPVFSKKSLEGKQWQKEPLLVGSGPYKIQSSDLGKFILYERVRPWWGEKAPCNKGFYNFDTLKVTYYADSRVGFEAFKKGLIDWWRDERISNWHQGYDFAAAERGEVMKVAFDKPFYHGLTGIFINTRRPYLSDGRIRKALTLLFDFEWLNKARFFHSYKRNTSIFMNSGYGAPQKMSVAERNLCRQYSPSSLPQGLKDCSYSSNKMGPFMQRDRFRQALDLFKEAGWVLKKGKLVSQETGQPMVLDLVVYTSGQVALFQDFLHNLQKVGIEASITISDWSGHTCRLRTLDFDLVLHFHPHVVIPGPEQELFWSSKWAASPSTLNLSGVQDPLVDDLVTQIKTAKNLATLKTYTALLDRIIGLGYYLIPGWCPQKSYLAYWRKLNVLPKDASLYDTDTWWVKALEKKGL